MRLRPSMSATRPNRIAPNAEASSAVESDEAHRHRRRMPLVFQDRHNDAYDEQIIGVGEEAHPEMNMIFQCCFVISESSIRVRMSVSLSGVLRHGGIPRSVRSPGCKFSSRKMKF
jgi:hypothetical protein